MAQPISYQKAPKDSWNVGGAYYLGYAVCTVMEVTG